MPVSTTEEEITSTSSRHALSMKTKSFAWRAWPSRIWSRTTRWQRPSVMSDGASLSANWNTSPNGTDEPLSRLTAGIPLPRPVMHASMYSTPYPWTDVNGSVLHVAWFTTVTPMPLSTFWRRGSPSRPVEAMEDLFGRRLDRRLPVKQETLIREDEKPLAFGHGEMSLLPFFCGSRRGLCLLFYKQGCMLLTKKKFTAPGQKLCIGGWLTTGVTAPNMCFNGFHSKMPPELDVYSYEQSQRPVQSHVISKLYHTTKWPVPGYDDFYSKPSVKALRIHLRDEASFLVWGGEGSAPHRAIASNFWHWLYKLHHDKAASKALLYKCALQGA